MHDDIPRINKHPVAGFLALDLGKPPEIGFDPINELSEIAATCREERPEQITM